MVATAKKKPERPDISAGGVPTADKAAGGAAERVVVITILGVVELMIGLGVVWGAAADAGPGFVVGLKEGRTVGSAGRVASWNPGIPKPEASGEM